MALKDWNLEANEEAGQRETLRHKLERRTNTNYPLRYSAFGAPHILFVAEVTDLKTTRSRELAAYYEPIQNQDYPDLEDGIFAGIVNFQGIQYLAEVHATQPWKGRAQKNAHMFFADFNQAIAWLEAQIPIFQEFIHLS